jgi:hypothetical protein
VDTNWQDSRRRNTPGDKRHTDPEDVYVKQEKIGMNSFSALFIP